MGDYLGESQYVKDGVKFLSNYEGDSMKIQTLKKAVCFPQGSWYAGPWAKIRIKILNQVKGQWKLSNTQTLSRETEVSYAVVDLYFNIKITKTKPPVCESIAKVYKIDKNFNLHEMKLQQVSEYV